MPDVVLLGDSRRQTPVTARQRSRCWPLTALLALGAVLACRRPPPTRSARSRAASHAASDTPAIDLAPVIAVAALPLHDSAAAPSYAAIGAAATRLASDARAGRPTPEIAARLRALRGQVLEERRHVVPSVLREDAALREASDALATAGLAPEAAAMHARHYADLDRAMAARVLRGGGPVEWEALLDAMGPLRDGAHGLEARHALAEQVTRAQERVARVALLRPLAGTLRDAPPVRLALEALDRTASPEALDALARATDAALATLPPARRQEIARLPPLADAGYGTGWTSFSVRRAQEALAAAAGGARLPPWALQPDPRLDAGVTPAGLAAALAALDRAIEQVTGARPEGSLTPAMSRAAARCRQPLRVRPAGPGAARIVFDDRVVDLDTRTIAGSLVPAPVQLVDGDTIFRLCGDGVLRAHALATGRVLWAAPTRPECGALAHDDARVYCIAPNSLSAHARTDGRAVTVFESAAPLIESVVLLEGTAVVLLADGSLRFVRLSDGAPVREVPRPTGTEAATPGSFFVAQAARLACVRRSFQDRDQLECFDARGASRWTRDVPTGQVVPRGGQEVRERTLYLDRVGRAHLLYTTRWGPSSRTVVLALQSGEVVADLPLRAAGLVERPDGALEGVLTLTVETTGGRRDASLALHAPETGAERFRTRVDFDGDTTAALLQGDQLDVAVYGRIAMMAAVYALDVRTGALRWRYPTGRMVRGHSEYANAVTLEESGGDLLVRGYESGGSYLVALDPATGARRMLVLPRHCASGDDCAGW